MARITATPGRFCEAIVTTNSGSARLMAAPSVNNGAVNTGRARPRLMPAALKPLVAATKTTAASKVSGTA